MHDLMKHISLFSFFSDINMRPVFTNIPVTINILEDMAIGTEIFNVSQYDAEGDPPTFLFTGFSPAACSSLYRLSATGIK